MEIVFVILVLVALFIVVNSKEGFMETSYYYGAAPGARGDRMVCMPEDESVTGLGVSVGNIVGSNSCAPPMPSVCQQYVSDPKAKIINYPAAQFAPVDLSAYDLPPATYAAIVDPSRPAGNQSVGLSLGKTGVAYRRIGNSGVFPFIKIGGKWIPVKKNGENQWVVDESGTEDCAARAQSECVGTRGKDREACLRASKAACAGTGGVASRPWSSTMANKPSAATCAARAQKECKAIRGKDRVKCLTDSKKRCAAGKPEVAPRKPKRPSAATCAARAQKECKAIRGKDRVKCLTDSKKRCAAGKPEVAPRKPKKPSAAACTSLAQKECGPLFGKFRDTCLKDSKKRCAAGKPAAKKVNANTWCAAAAKKMCKSKKDKKARDKCTKDAKKKCTGK